MQPFFFSVLCPKYLQFAFFTLAVSSSVKEIENDSVIRVDCCVDKVCVISYNVL